MIRSSPTACARRRPGRSTGSIRRKPSREMYESMSEKQLEEFAETKRKGLPSKKS
ncbi:DUF3008 family protein [Mesorhizobium sp. M1E.F.Ca.ET.063.01.1.1]|nr:DUF3008 family protein [Mesorhizobium sp. M1E.F.Ca.ET.063.01.1.1]